VAILISSISSNIKKQQYSSTLWSNSIPNKHVFLLLRHSNFLPSITFPSLKTMNTAFTVNILPLWSLGKVCRNYLLRWLLRPSLRMRKAALSILFYKSLKFFASLSLTDIYRRMCLFPLSMKKKKSGGM
jgi:hypothetical protein